MDLYRAENPDDTGRVFRQQEPRVPKVLTIVRRGSRVVVEVTQVAVDTLGGLKRRAQQVITTRPRSTPAARQQRPVRPDDNERPAAVVAAATTTTIAEPLSFSSQPVPAGKEQAPPTEDNRDTRRKGENRDTSVAKTSVVVDTLKDGENGDTHRKGDNRDTPHSTTTTSTTSSDNEALPPHFEMPGTFPRTFLRASRQQEVESPKVMAAPKMELGSNPLLGRVVKTRTSTAASVGSRRGYRPRYQIPSFEARKIEVEMTTVDDALAAPKTKVEPAPVAPKAKVDTSPVAKEVRFDIAPVIPQLPETAAPSTSKSDHVAITQDTPSQKLLQQLGTIKPDTPSQQLLDDLLAAKADTPSQQLLEELEELGIASRAQTQRSKRKERLEKAAREAQLKAEEELAKRRRVYPKGQVFVSLTNKMNHDVDATLLITDPNREVAMQDSREPVTRKSMGTLLPTLRMDSASGWLNDEIVNAYMALILQRAKTDDPEGKYHAFNSNFYQNFTTKGYDSVKRWASRAKINGANLLKLRHVFIPICKGNHWTLLVISPANREIEYFDSLGGSARKVTTVARDWLRAELGALYVDREWEIPDSSSPRQNNGSDCGVFVCTTARLITAGINPMAYGAKDIPDQRRRMVAELLGGSLL